MARSNSSGVGLFVAAAIAVVAAGAAIGYYVIGGSRSNGTGGPTQVVQQTAPPAGPSLPGAAPAPAVRPHKRGTDYTAPGAPHISIKEDKNPILRDDPLHKPKRPSETPDIPTPDSEASQENGTAAPPAHSPDAPTGDTNPDTAPTGHDSEANQEGSGPPAPPKPAPAGAAPLPARAQYRVQAGAFVDSRNARELADSLRAQGYEADMRTDKDSGGRTVYKVQVGAYRSRDAAEKAASELKSQGIDASVAPISE